MPEPIRSPFGRLLVDPPKLTFAERVDVTRQLSGTLQAHADLGMRWLGAGLSEWLQRGGSLEVVLGLRPPRGGHQTAQRIVRAEHVDRMLARLVCSVHGQARAARILSGAEPAPAAVADLVAQLHTLGAPCSRRSIVAAVHRARRRDCAA